MKPRITTAEVLAHPEWARTLYLQGAPSPTETERGRRHLTGAGLRTTRTSTTEIHMQHPPLVRLVSFGFLHSAPPPEAHVVVDLRTHFRDPQVSPEMRQLTSSNPRVRAHVLNTPGVPELVEAITATALAMASGPARADVVIAIGCAGGRHRAPTVTREVAERLEEREDVDVQLDTRHLTRPVVNR